MYQSPQFLQAFTRGVACGVGYPFHVLPAPDTAHQVRHHWPAWLPAPTRIRPNWTLGTRPPSPPPKPAAKRSRIAPDRPPPPLLRIQPDPPGPPRLPTVISQPNNCPVFGVKMDNPDQVNRPSHYRKGSLETIQAIEGLGLGYFEGNVLKYLSRYKHKGKPLEDLRKAQWYLARLIEREAQS